MTETQMRICPDVPDLTVEEAAARERAKWRHLQSLNLFGNARGGGRKGRPVVCVETGIEYPSATKASHAVGLRSSCKITVACRRGCVCAGYHWRFAPRINRVPEGTPVVCRETGERFDSTTAAANAIRVAVGRMTRALKLGQRVRGLHFAYANQQGAA